MDTTIKQHLPKWIICVLLAIVTAAAFYPTAQSSFIRLDDVDYVVDNPHVQEGFSWAAIKWAFVSFHSSNWHPLTWLSHMLDCRLYGLNPAGPHLTNLAFHIANTVLLFLLLYNLTAQLWPGAFVALLFAIHPMHVESVAWVSERKDVLSAFFFLLTLLTYARYVELAGILSRRTRLVYGLALLLFVLGLLAKPMLVTLPFVLCLLDVWPLARVQLPLASQPRPVLRSLIVEKIPFLMLAALSCGITYVAQSTTRAIKPLVDFPLAARLAHIPVACAWYMLKLIWPLNLSIFHVLHAELPAHTVAGALLLLLILTALALLLAGRHPCLLVGWLWFVGMLVPVLGLVQVGNQDYADRYTYLPYIGLFIIIAWGIPAWLSKWPCHRPLILFGALLAASACCKLTVDQVQLWKNGQTLFARAIALDPANEEAWALQGLNYLDQGKLDKAIDCLRRATKLNHRYYQAWHDLGSVLFVKGNYAEAEDAFQMALLYDPDKVEIYNNLGNVLMTAGRYQEAIADFQNSLALRANQPDIQTKLGRCFLHNNEPDQAVVELQKAIAAQPDNAAAQLGLAMILGDTGRVAEAIAHYRQVVELETNSIIALNNLAWLLTTAADPRLRNGTEAVQLAERACKLTAYRQAYLIGTLAAAYAEAGRFHEAIATAQEAQAVALANGQKDIADRNRRLIELYKTGQAFHVDNKLPPAEP